MFDTALVDAPMAHAGAVAPRTFPFPTGANVTMSAGLSKVGDVGALVATAYTESKSYSAKR